MRRLNQRGMKNHPNMAFFVENRAHIYLPNFVQNIHNTLFLYGLLLLLFCTDYSIAASHNFLDITALSKPN